MNAKELAEKMLAYGDAQEVANALKTEIETAVLDLEKTQTVGNVKATFRNGRKSYDYKAGAEDHPMVSDATLSLFTTQPAPKIDWHKICKHAGIEDVPCTVGKPSVTVALV
jgi:hypothetical protein